MGLSITFRSTKRYDNDLKHCELTSAHIYINIALFFYFEKTVWNSINLFYANYYLMYKHTISICFVKLEYCHIVILIILYVKVSYLSVVSEKHQSTFYGPMPFIPLWGTIHSQKNSRKSRLAQVWLMPNLKLIL